MAGSYFITELDLASAYWQMLVDPRDRHKAAFMCPDGRIRQWNRGPMGLDITGQVLCRYVNDTVLDGYLHDFAASPSCDWL